jgi:hypothetical protein
MPLTFPQAYADEGEFYKKIFALNSTNDANIAIDLIVPQGSTATFGVDERNYGFSLNMTNCEIAVYNMVDPTKISHARSQFSNQLVKNVQVSLEKHFTSLDRIFSIFRRLVN